MDDIALRDADEDSELPRYTETVSYTDGIRDLTFVEPEYVRRPSIWDKGRILVESFMGQALDWGPLPEVVYECKPGDTRMYWKWGSHVLYVGIRRDMADLYKEKCCVPLTDPNMLAATGPAILPLYNSPSKDSISTFITAADTPQPSNSASSRNSRRQQPATWNGSQSSRSSLTSRASQNTTNEFYFLVNKPFATPVTSQISVNYCSALASDQDLCFRLRENYKSLRGFRGNWISLKNFGSVEFIKFVRIFTGRQDAACTESGLPGWGQGYDYVYANTSISDYIHTIVISRQLQQGIKKPSTANVGKDLISSLPKNLYGPLGMPMGTQGWGVQAVDRWSVARLMFCVSAATAIGFLFVFLWLGIKDKNDVQTAFVPLSYIVGMLCFVVALPQLLSDS